MTKSFYFKVLAGLLILAACGLLLLGISGLDPKDLNTESISSDYALYRFGFYLLILACWPLIVIYITRYRGSYDDITDEKLDEIEKNIEEDRKLLRSKWWKLAIFLSVFEIGIVNQFGIG